MEIDTIRNDITNKLGNYVEVLHNEGRNKVYKYRGRIVEVYSNIFIILDNNSKKCFSYYDVLTKTIKISFKM